MSRLAPRCIAFLTLLLLLTTSALAVVFCTNCGTRYESGERFCSRDGTRLGRPSGAPEPSQSTSEASSSLDAAPEIEKPPGPPPETLQVLRLTIVGASIAPGKSDGKPWDSSIGGGAVASLAGMYMGIPPAQAAIGANLVGSTSKKVPPPDPLCLVAIGNEKVRSRKIQDTLDPGWNFSHSFVYDRSKAIRIEVIDKDLFEDDPIGTLVLSDPSKLSLGEHQTEAFGSVLGMRYLVEFDPKATCQNYRSEVTRAWRQYTASGKRVRNPSEVLEVIDDLVTARFFPKTVRCPEGGLFLFSGSGPITCSLSH